jgi:hypothetical protein
MEDKDRPGDDALQEEQEPCRQADHGSQTFPSCTQSHRMFLNLVFCIFFWPYVLAVSVLLALRAVIAIGSSLSSEMGASLKPYCRLAMTAADCHEFYTASENSDIRNGSLCATFLQVFHDSCILP